VRPIVLAVAVTSALAVAASAHVHYAMSSSLPIRGSYLVWPARSWPLGNLRRGDLVEACPPLTAASAARALGYAPAGSCPGHIIPFLKFVAAVGGDRVSIDSSGVAVNGRLLPNSAPRRLSDGRWIVTPAFGSKVLAAGEVWLYGTNSRSLDSRYFGPIAASQVRNEAWARFSEAVPDLR
jgi:conjugative transfer signal peptidase TraF